MSKPFLHILRTRSAEEERLLWLAGSDPRLSPELSEMKLVVVICHVTPQPPLWL